MTCSDFSTGALNVDLTYLSTFLFNKRLTMSAIRAARPIAANSALRAITRPALSFRSFAFVAPRPSRIALARPGPSFRYKVTRSKFAQNPLITYEELKPIADQPNDVSTQQWRVSRPFSADSPGRSPCGCTRTR